MPLQDQTDFENKTEFLVVCLVERLNTHAPFSNVIDGAFSFKTTNPNRMKTIKLWGDKWEKDMLDGNK